jgi:hypothetical protein
VTIAADRRTGRRPIWSCYLTEPLAEQIPRRWRVTTVRLVRALHTAAFFLIAGCIVIFAVDGVMGRPGRRSAVAGAIGLAEAAVYGSNNLVCPLSPLAERLGAESGSVTDLYLPRWISDRIPLFGGTALVFGLLVQGLALGRRSARARGRSA